MLCRVIIFVIFSLATATKTTGNRSHPCRPSNSSQEVFKCVQGSDCIDTQYVCDGTEDCSDGSDEHSCFTRKRRQSGSCILPPYPDHGSYEIVQVPMGNQKRPGESLETFVLQITCEPGYGMTDTDTDVDSGGVQEVFCISGKWSQSMPKCVRFCKLNPDPSVRYMCTGSKICKKFVPPDSLVKPVCNSPVYYSTENLPYMRCFSGSWEYVAKCKPDCGRITPGGVQLLTDGTTAKRGELPWHVGIYRKTKPYMQICGGSLVTNNVVISAAHCFWSDTKKLLSPSYFAVAVGKLYRPWDDPRDTDAQKSDVKHIAVPILFRGAAANFQEDIAILTLTDPFIYETYIRPICLSFEGSFERLHLQQDNLGKVAGWGLTAANGDASNILKVVGMPFINEATCVNTLPQSFTAYITGDKFCAGYTNGTALCKGDSGGGIVFAEKEQGLHRYYLRGIVSTAPTADDKMCNDRSYTTFTRITKHEDFIQNSLAVATLAGCPPNTFQCGDGTCRDREANCGQNRQPVFIPATCPEGELYYPGDQKDDWLCDCMPAFLYDQRTNRCWPAYRKGPCEDGHYLVLGDETAIPYCERNPCYIKDYVIYNGKCELLGSTTPCNNKYPDVEALTVNSTTLVVNCERIRVVSRFQEEDKKVIPLSPCRAGSKRSINGKCTTTMTP